MINHAAEDVNCKRVRVKILYDESIDILENLGFVVVLAAEYGSYPAVEEDEYFVSW